jgi:DUF4097 and DUF4098 domain-containing protein YvlB
VTNGHANGSVKLNGVHAKSEVATSNGHANGNGVDAKKVESFSGSILVVGFRYNEYDGMV